MNEKNSGRLLRERKGGPWQLHTQDDSNILGKEKELSETLEIAKVFSISVDRVVTEIAEMLSVIISCIPTTALDDKAQIDFKLCVNIEDGVLHFQDLRVMEVKR